MGNTVFMKTNDTFKTFLYNFIKCGVLGWCLEIIFTALHSFQKRDMRLFGQTSLWMFPIYGLAAFLQPISRLMHSCSLLLRGTVYSFSILFAEYISGLLLWRKNCCPWDYYRSKWHVRHVIRLDYFPVWFAVGLLFERILTSEK